MNIRVAVHFGIASAVGLIVCWSGPLQAKQWILKPQGEQEVKAGQADPDRQELDAAHRLLVQGKPGKAHKMLGKWIKKFANSPLRSEAMYYTGQSLEKRGKVYKAFEKYEELAQNFGNADYFHKALEAQFGIAQQYLNGKKRPMLGIFKISADDVGIKILERIAERWPGSNLSERSLMLLGDYYLKQKQYDDAIANYRQLIVSYPLSVFVRGARLHEAKASLGKFRGSAFDPAPLVEAKECLLKYQALYGPNAQSDQVQPMLAKINDLQSQRQYQIGRFYERTGKKDSARLSFEGVIRHWPSSKWAREAQKKLHKLGKKKAAQAQKPSAVTKAGKKG